MPRPVGPRWIRAALATCAVLAGIGAPRRESGADARVSVSASVSASASTPRADVSLRLDLNLPAFRLDVYENEQRTLSFPVAIGMTRFRTPRGAYRIDHIVWNPWWIPPASEWAAKERPHPPGWANPVGRVKLHVHDLVFLHGTPFENSLKSAASHACVRMLNADAIRLARLVHAYASPRISLALLDSLEGDTARTRRIDLDTPIAITVRYELAEVRDDTLLMHPDVYGLGAAGSVANRVAAATEALAREGEDTTALRHAALRALSRRAGRTTARLPLDSLRLAPPRER